MRAEDVLAVLELLERAAVEVWLDGGWGVDALLCEQTRPHEDLDLVVRAESLEHCGRALRDHGFRLSGQDGPYPPARVDDAGRRIDVRALELDVTRTHERDAASLTGSGRVRGRRVDCRTAESQIAAHTGYPIGADDERDVLALHHRFGVPLAGRVRTWHEAAGWGVLDADNLRDDVWAHFSAVEGDGRVEPSAGQTVLFSVEDAPDEDPSVEGAARGGCRRRALTVRPASPVSPALARHVHGAERPAPYGRYGVVRGGPSPD